MELRWWALLACVCAALGIAHAQVAPYYVSTGPFLFFFVLILK